MNAKRKQPSAPRSYGQVSNSPRRSRGLKQRIQRRMYAVLVVLCIMPLAVAVQLVRIYASERAELVREGIDQSSAAETIPAVRGTILDRAGRALVVNTASYRLALDPSLSGQTDDEIGAFLDRLAALTGRAPAYYRRRVKERTSPQYVLLERGLSEEHKETIETWEAAPRGLILRPTFRRRYNYDATAAHVVGHVDSDGRGIEGLELQYEDVMRGTPGSRTVQLDRRGRVKAYVPGYTVEPQDGQTLVLTIDLILQSILEEELIAAVNETDSRWGTGIAMDPRTGAVLAMANVPTYNPNRPRDYEVGAMRNRAITDRVEPGSTFKLVTAVAGVESGAVSLDEVLDTGNGYKVVGGRGLQDLAGYGEITFAQAIAKSSNVGIGLAAIRLAPGTFFQYARNLGFGQKTWIDLPGEVTGTLKKPHEWSGITLPSLSIGYEVDATPLQILTAYCSLANGGLMVRPYVVAERRDATGEVLWRAPQDSVRRAFKKSTADRLRPAFEEVVRSGSASLAHIEGLRVAGKTGTAEKVVNGSYDPGVYRASFVGYFPAENPVVAILVMLAEPKTGGNSGAVAAPVFRRIARRWVGTSPQIAGQMVPEPVLPDATPLDVPDVTGQPMAVAASRLRASGYRVPAPEARLAAWPVARQDPDPGTAWMPGRRVRLEAGPTVAPVDTMPDLTGLSARQAAYWLRAGGMNVKIEGRGQVVSQTPRAGEPVLATAVLRCR